MAKLRRYRRYRKSSRWAANIQEINATLSAGTGIFSNAETLVTNLAQDPQRTSQTYTIKNVEITFTLENESDSGDQEYGENGKYLEGVTIYIMYVPQGMNVTSQYNIQHPEYIMAYKYIGSPLNEIANQQTATTPEFTIGQTFQPTRIKTRLARKLQSGDNIILYIKGINQSSMPQAFRVNGVIRWWSKAN